MNIKLVMIILAVISLGIIGVTLANIFSGPDAGGTELRTTEQVIENPQSAPEPRANTFTVMTAEEKAAAEAEAVRKAEEEAAKAASSTATSTDETVEE